MGWISRLAELVQDWSYLAQRDCLMSALPGIAQEIAQLPYRHLRFLIMARSLSEPLPLLRPKIAIEIRPLEQTDVELVQQIDRPSEARASALRLALGHQGLIALCHSQPVGYAWGCAKVEPNLERVHLELEPGDALFVDAYTVPAFRGKGIQTALKLARFRLFHELGFQRVIAYIEENNAPSLASWRKVGAQVVQRIDFKRIGPWRRTRYC